MDGPARRRQENPLKHGFFDFTGPNSTPWAMGVNPNAGTLGESPLVYLGLYDTRPWEGMPTDPGSAEDWANMQTVEGDLILRLQSMPAKPPGGSNLFGTSQIGDMDVFRYGCLSLVLSAWQNTDSIDVWGDISTGDGRAVANPAPPPTNTRLNFATGQAWLGPNLLPSLTGQNTISVDLGRWTRGARFVGAWLWPYWVGVPTPPALPLAWETWDLPPRDRKDLWPQVWPISWPQRVAQLGPLLSPPADNHLAFRWGPLPGGSAYRLSGMNGGAWTARMAWRRYFGPAFVEESVNIVAASPPGVAVLPLFDAADAGADLTYGATHHFIYAASQSAVDLSGPLILSLTSSAYGL